MNYYSFNIDKYRSATAHLNNAEDICYRRILDIAYDTEKPIEQHGLARKIRCAESIVTKILNEFFKLTDEGWVHPVVQKQLMAIYRKSKRASSSAKARWAKDANAMRTQCERNANDMQQPCDSYANAMLHNTEYIIHNTEDTPKGASASSDAKPTAQKKKQTNEEWLAELPTYYPHIEINNELRKMDAWLSTRPGKQKTRRFIVNWLNKIEAPLKNDHTNHRDEKRSREFSEQIEVPELI